MLDSRKRGLDSFPPAHTPFLLGEAVGSEIAFASVLPVSPGSGAERFLLEKQKNQSSCRKTKSSSLLPLSCPSAPWGQEGRMLLEAWIWLEPSGVLPALQGPPAEARAVFVIWSEANAGRVLRRRTLVFLGRWGGGRGVWFSQAT